MAAPGDRAQRLADKLKNDRTRSKDALKRARKLAQIEKVERRNRAIGKKSASKCFNDPITPAQFEKWSAQLDPGHLDKKQLNQVLEKTVNSRKVPDNLIYTQDHTQGWERPLAFVSMLYVALKRPWDQHPLATLGWKSNCTGYEPFDVSADIEELQSAVLNQFVMGIKQLLRVIEFKESQECPSGHNTKQETEEKEEKAHPTMDKAQSSGSTISSASKASSS
jgi:hypothetical protein